MTTDRLPDAQAIREYLTAARAFLAARAAAGESPAVTLGGTAWGHKLVDLLLDVTSDADRLARETARLLDALDHQAPAA